MNQKTQDIPIFSKEIQNTKQYCNLKMEFIRLLVRHRTMFRLTLCFNTVCILCTATAKLAGNCLCRIPKSLLSFVEMHTF